MPDLYPFVRPILRRLGPELSRDIALKVLEFGAARILVDAEMRSPDPLGLAQRVWNIDFPNPIGLAAGYDKNARVPDALLLFGFGFIEIGTVTPRPQHGNQKPRVFRLEADQAIINRMGFNNHGLERVLTRLKNRYGRPGLIGLNLGKNRDTEDAASDYEIGILRSAGLVDYLVVNVSSPNTPGLRDLQLRGNLEFLLRRLVEARNTTGFRTPLLVKIAPDLDDLQRRDIAEIVLETGVDGVIVANTTVSRPLTLASRHAREVGGLSGRPLFAPSTALLADMYRLTGGKLPLVGVGGVWSAADAYTKIRAGASLVQLHTAVAFEGPGLAASIKKGLTELLRRDGFRSVAEAVGVGNAAGAAGSPASPSLAA